MNPLMMSKNDIVHSHFDEDGAEGKDATQKYDDARLHEPLLLGDGSRHCVDATGVVGLTSHVATEHGAHQ